MYEVAGLKRELGLERQEHRATREHLGRALRAASYWKQEAERLGRGDTEPTPNPMPLPTLVLVGGGGGDDDGGGDGGDVGTLVLTTIGCLARLGEPLATGDETLTPMVVQALLGLARHRLDRLEHRLLRADAPHPHGGPTPGGEGDPHTTHPPVAQGGYPTP